MGLGESLDDLETIDQPRGVVRAANKYAQDKIQLAAVLSGAAESERQRILEWARIEHEKHWNAFHAGAQWAASQN